MKVRIVEPPFTRPDDEPEPLKPPYDVTGWATLYKASEKQLHRLGLRRWDDEGNNTLWLLPGEWYDAIPDGFPLTDICFNTVKFKKGKSDRDIRFGCLAYGILKEKEA